MATLRERVENHPIVFFLGAILAGFLAGLAAYQGVLNISDQMLVLTSEHTALKEEVEKLKVEAEAPREFSTKMSPIMFDWDMHGDDIGRSVPVRYPGECLKACAGKTDCKAWAFEPPDKCWLKSRIPQEKDRRSRTNYASGIKSE